MEGSVVGARKTLTSPACGRGSDNHYGEHKMAEWQSNFTF